MSSANRAERSEAAGRRDSFPPGTESRAERSEAAGRRDSLPSGSANFFSSDEFFEAVAHSRFPGARCQPDVFQVGDRAYRLLRVGDEVVRSVPYADFFEPIEPYEAPAEMRRIDHLPSTSRRQFRGDLETAPQLAADAQLAPFAEWRGFSNWDSYAGLIQERSRTHMSLVKRNRRNLERKAGEVRFEPRNEDPSLLELCLTLKSLQYRRTKLPDLLASERNRGLFRTLLARRVLWVSVLWAGPQPAAIHAGVLHGRRFYYWLPVYEPALSQASPGRLLLMELMRWSLESGHEEFDFLLGDEAYKRTYATGARIIEPDGDPPLPMRLWNAARARLMPRVRAHPLLYSFLQNGKRSFLTHAG